MNSHSFNSSFAKQFRHGHTVYFGSETMSYQNLLFRTFGINITEISSLSELLTPQLHDEAIIHRQLVKLTNNDIPNAEKLQLFVEETSKKLFNHDNAELHTSPYYNQLIEVFRSFLALVDEFKTNGIQTLSSKLTEYFTSEINQPADSEEVRNIYESIEDYRYRMGEYSHHFHLLLRQESESHEDNARVLVMSEVGYYFETLFNFTEILISHTESTLNMLYSWETALQIREKQELYN